MSGPCLIYTKKSQTFEVIQIDFCKQMKKKLFSFNQACCWLGIPYSYITIVMNIKNNIMYATRHDCQWNEWEMQRTQEDEERRKTNIGHDQIPVLNFLLS